MARSLTQELDRTIRQLQELLDAFKEVRRIHEYGGHTPEQVEQLKRGARRWSERLRGKTGRKHDLPTSVRLVAQETQGE